MSPYENLPARNYWKTGVAQPHALEIRDLYTKKFDISAETRIATAGSCFAQHIRRRLSENGFKVLDMEPAPLGLTLARYSAYGFGQFSARYGNIYTARQLLQLVQEALGLLKPRNGVWKKGDFYVDGLRPAIEPNGFQKPEQVAIHRGRHLFEVRGMLAQMNLMVFTLGLTEAWVDKADDVVYPTAPGTVAQPPDASSIEFKNFTVSETIADFLAFRKLVHQFNPECRFLLTVSPVPLTATAGSEHVLLATTYSKSVLRAAAGELAGTLADVDYFPSYELISSPVFKGFFFDANLRTVSAAGVDFVMKTFFQAHRPHAGGAGTGPAAPSVPAVQFDAACEDALLEAFAK